MSRNVKINKENRKKKIAQKHIVQMDEVPDEEIENPLTVCSPLRDETSSEYFQISTINNESRISQSNIQSPTLHSKSENRTEVYLNDQTKEASAAEEQDYSLLNKPICKNIQEAQKKSSDDDEQLINPYSAYAKSSEFTFTNSFGNENANDENGKLTHNLLTKLAHKAETTLVNAAAAQYQELSQENEHNQNHELNIYQPPINLANPNFLENNFSEDQEKNQLDSNKVDVENNTDVLAESTVAQTAIEMIEQIIDELYDSCLKPDCISEIRNLNITQDVAVESSELVQLNKSNEDPSYGVNETSRLLNSSSDDELETDHVVPDYIRFKEEDIIKHGSDSNTILPVIANSDCRNIIVETPIAPAKKQLPRKKTPKEENVCSICCFL